MRQLAASIVVIALCLVMQTGVHAAGVWTKLANPSPGGGSESAVLLTDGTVMVQVGVDVASKTWKKLTPDSSGNYINGTWSSMSSMGLERLFFASNVLPSGKVFVLGGEYSGPNTSANFTNSGEIYDPVADSWSTIATFPNPIFGDDPTVVLPNGKILCGYIADARTYLYDPVANTWSQTGTKLRNDESDEETWAMLPGGDILSYDIFSSPAKGAGHAQRYKWTTGTWVDAGSVPVPLTSYPGLGYELGPSGLLPDGRVIQIGANNNTVIYNPSTNSWTRGPSLPTGMGADDAPGAVLPNGRFIFAADTPITVPSWNPVGPTSLFEYDYTTNKLSTVNLPSALAADLAGPAFLCRMLILPNGHMLLITTTGSLWDYAPSGTPQASWAPTITNVAKSTTNSNVYTITGTQLTGISEGAGYGDDAEMATNYPIVRLTDAKGLVRFARSSNWTPGVATGNLLTTCQFELPPKLPIADYTLNVIANGIPSANFKFSLANPSNVDAVFDAATKTLKITGDANSNSLTVSLQAGVLKVEGANDTTINHTSLFSVNVTGQIIVNAVLGDGNDSIAVIGIDSSATNVDLGPGSDKAAFTLCNISNLTVDGGAGTDVVTVTSSTTGTFKPINVP